MHKKSRIGQADFVQFADRGGLFPEKPEFSRRRSPAWEKVHTYFIFNPDIPRSKSKRKQERAKKSKTSKRAKERKKKKAKPLFLLCPVLPMNFLPIQNLQKSESYDIINI